MSKDIEHEVSAEMHRMAEDMSDAMFYAVVGVLPDPQPSSICRADIERLFSKPLPSFPLTHLAKGIHVKRHAGLKVENICT